MAVEALTMAHLEVVTTNISDHVTDIEIDVNNDDQEITTFGSGGGQDFGPGLERSMLSFTVLNDYAASSVNDLFDTARKTKVAFTCRQSTAAVSATNPSYSGTIYVGNWKPLSGAPGDFQAISVTYPVCGTVTKATS